jgi:hypothetical protein
MEMGFLAAAAWLWHLVFFAVIFVCGWLSSALAPALRTAVSFSCWWFLSVIWSACVASRSFVSRYIL